MEVMHRAAWRTAKSSFASLLLVASLNCNVYDSSLLGNGGPGGARAMGGSGTSGTTGGADTTSGAGGEPELGGSAAGAGFGGLIGMAGSSETGGAEMGGSAAGSPEAEAGKGGSPAVSGGTSGTSGTSGGAGASGAGGVVQTASGCAKLSVPLDATSDKAHFVISLTSTADLSGATLSMRVYVQAGQGGTIFNYVQDSGTYHFLGVPDAQRRSISSSSGWSTISWNVGAEPDSAGTGIVKTSIKNIGIELNALPSSAWVNPTIVYIDSISVTNPTLSFTFDATASVSPTPSTTNAAGQALWLNSGTSDTTATGATLGWQAMCP